MDLPTKGESVVQESETMDVFESEARPTVSATVSQNDELGTSQPSEAQQDLIDLFGSIPTPSESTKPIEHELIATAAPVTVDVPSHQISTVTEEESVTGLSKAEHQGGTAIVREDVLVSISDEDLATSIPARSRSKSDVPTLPKVEHIAYPSIDSAIEKVPSAAAAATGSTTSYPQENSQETVFKLRNIEFGGRPCQIVMQERNGPCPLIALVNAFVLKGKRVQSRKSSQVTHEELLNYLGSALLDNSEDKQTPDDANYYNQVQEALGLMENAEKGLNLNIRFNEVKDFEFSTELSLFDLCGVNLYHGWLIDPEDKEMVAVVGKSSYNQLTDECVALALAEDDDSMLRRDYLEQFLNSAQLTFHGHARLLSVMREGELAILFRNCHFHTLYRKKDDLFALVTDVGFSEYPECVWETVEQTGDSQFANSKFQLVLPERPGSGPPTEQEKSDYAMAKQMQEQMDAEEQRYQEQQAARAAAAQQQQQSRQQTPVHNPSQYQNQYQTPAQHPAFTQGQAYGGQAHEGPAQQGQRRGSKESKCTIS